MLEFGRDLCSDPRFSTEREWLVTNGLGGYASGTVAGTLTRRYHGLLVVAAIGPLLSYVTLVLVKGRYLISTIRVLPMQLLKGMLFFLTVSLLNIGFYFGYTEGGGVTLLGAALFLPYALLAPLVIGTYLDPRYSGFASVRNAPS